MFHRSGLSQKKNVDSSIGYEEGQQWEKRSSHTGICIRKWKKLTARRVKPDLRSSQQPRRCGEHTEEQGVAAAKGSVTLLVSYSICQGQSREDCWLLVFSRQRVLVLHTPCFNCVCMVCSTRVYSNSASWSPCDLDLPFGSICVWDE